MNSTWFCLLRFLTCGDWHFFLSGAGTSRWFYGAELHSLWAYTWPQVRTSQYGTWFLDKSSRCRAWNRLNGWRMVPWQLQQRPLAFSCALFVSMPLFERLVLTSECACAVNRRTDSFFSLFLYFFQFPCLERMCMYWYCAVVSCIRIKTIWTWFIHIHRHTHTLLQIHPACAS